MTDPFGRSAAEVRRQLGRADHVQAPALGGGRRQWRGDAGVRATDVSGCITVQVDNATTARNNMPAMPYPTDTRTAPSQATAFTSGDFATAQPLVADPEVYTSRERALHRQAASTMQQFQDNSRDVYATVPQFAPPNLRRTPLGQPPEQPPTPQPPTPQPQPVPSGVPRTSGGPAGPRGSVPGASPRPATPLAPGGGSSTTEPAPARPAAAASAPGRPAAAGPGLGGMPMGGAQGQRNEDTPPRAGSG